MSKARHDLRNPLGEVLGFAEIILEEAASLGHPELVPRFQAICDDANELLRQLNRIIEIENLRQRPESLDTLRESIAGFCQRCVAASGEISARCHTLNGTPFLDDLERIAAAARQMSERAPLLLGDLFEGEHDLINFRDLRRTEDGFESVVTGDTIFIHKPPGTSAPTGAAARASDTGTVFFSKNVQRVPAAFILVVDDNEANRALLTRRLGRNGHTVAHAEDGLRALEMVRRQPFDLVLLDMLMPNMNGHEVLAAMKADRALRHIPVIMITGLDDIANLIGCIEGGAEDYLTKPFDPVLLDARIGACLEKKRLRDQEQVYLRQIENEKRRSDDLLHVILPHAIAEELKSTQTVRPQRHENVAVLFSDVAGFTAYCDQNPPELVMEHLQTLVRDCEEIAARHGLEKIKTIGDAFMAAGGLIEPLENPALNCVRAAFEMARAAESLPCKWTLHVGVHIGPVIAGVVGRRKYMYDIWGDTVNTAARVAGAAGSSRIHVSADVWNRIAPHVCGRSSGLHPLKGKGDLELFHVESLAG